MHHLSLLSCIIHQKFHSGEVLVVWTRRIIALICREVLNRFRDKRIQKKFPSRIWALNPYTNNSMSRILSEITFKDKLPVLETLTMTKTRLVNCKTTTKISTNWEKLNSSKKIMAFSHSITSYIPSMPTNIENSLSVTGCFTIREHVFLDCLHSKINNPSHNNLNLGILDDRYSPIWREIPNKAASLRRILPCQTRQSLNLN